MPAEKRSFSYILGLDLGSNSLGWAVIPLEQDKPARLEAAGSRIFEAGILGLETGRDEPLGQERRTARQMRRQTDRRARRQRRIFWTLQAWGLLPRFADPNQKRDPLARKAILDQLDSEIRQAIRPRFSEVKSFDHVWIYLLRSLAAKEPLPEFFVGRVFYNLAQRRGFLSNRKVKQRSDQPDKKTETPGEVRQQIDALTAQLDGRTLGEFFCQLNPGEPAQRIRNRRTGRLMHEDEFSRIWDAQAGALPNILTEKRKPILRHLLYDQRPLKPVDRLIGRCTHEPGEKRAPKADLLSQRFRILQTVNNLTLIGEEGISRPLTPEERQAVISQLESSAKVTFAKLKKALHLPLKSRFNLEYEDEKELKGDIINARLSKAGGERWNQLTWAERCAVVRLLLYDEYADEDKAAAACEEQFGFDHDSALKLALEPLPAGYVSLSLKAMERLLPHLKSGLTYMEAVCTEYGPPRAGEPSDSLPALIDWERKDEVRNPAVLRSLTELRKVVNALIREYGKPAYIHVELARELRRNKKERQRYIKEQNERRAERETAKREIELPAPSGRDIEKYLLWEECGRCCPYSGEPISHTDLFGDSPKFDIEHIIPLSISQDNSFANKTLCHNEWNRRKGNRTPYAAFGYTTEWPSMLKRVHDFKSRGGRNQKLERFQMKGDEDELREEFCSRQLNDTRYASRLACAYLSLLYGGLSDDLRTRRIHTVTGGLTAFLRNHWRLSTVAGEKTGDKRVDHRHHAVDALVIGLIGPALIQQVALAAQEEHRTRGRSRYGRIVGPWPDFTDSVRNVIENITVSHRLNHRLRGALHDATIYSRRETENSDRGETSVRKPLTSLSTNQVASIADPTVRNLVKEALERIGGDPKKFTEETYPRMSRKGNGTPIRSVRIRTNDVPIRIGRDVRSRHVVTGGNHHVVLFEKLDANGNPKGWGAEVVRLIEAYRRKASGEPVIDLGPWPGRRYLFHLQQGDCVRMEVDGGPPAIYQIKKFSQEQSGLVKIGYRSHADATIDGTIERRPSAFGQWNCQKVVVDPLGNWKVAND